MSQLLKVLYLFGLNMMEGVLTMNINRTLAQQMMQLQWKYGGIISEQTQPTSLIPQWDLLSQDRYPTP